MRITYLGTGGGAGIPELFCSCRICKNARTVSGRETRNRSMALINDDLCIDLPCDARSSMLTHQVDPRKLKYFLITHNHYDHFMPDNFVNRPEGVQPMRLFISRGSGQSFAERCSKLQGNAAKGMRPIHVPEVCFLSSFETVTIGRYTVTALPANHDKTIECLNYIISDGESTVLWLHDTGILLQKTWDYLKEHRMIFDFISMDCSFSRGTNVQTEHMDIIQCKEQVEILRSMGCVKESTLVFLSHIGHNVNATHGDLTEEASDCGLYVAYDGMQICV